MKLYDAPWAPSPRRVRIFLAEKGIEIDREVIDLRQGAHLRPEFLAINPRGTLPVLELDDGEILTESVAICRYLEALNPEPALFGRSPVEMGRVENWIRQVEGDGYAAAVYMLRNNSPLFANRATPNATVALPQIPELAARGALMWTQFVATLDAQLAQNTWIAGDNFSFADITALVTIDFARAVKLTIGEGQLSLLRWYEAVSARASASA